MTPRPRPFVRRSVSPAALQHTAERLGIASDELTPARCAMALGGLPQGVSPLEQAAAYATFAAKGMYAQPYSIVRIKNRRGEVVYEHQTKTNPAMPVAEAGVINAALQGVVADGTGTAAAIGRPVAGKTGTTENHADDGDDASATDEHHRGQTEATGGQSDHTGAVTDTCPGCETAIDLSRIREQGDVERFSCLVCGLQLVRRPGGRWESIRG